MISISLGSGHIKSDFNGHSQLVGFYEQCSSIMRSEILVDFSGLAWFDANMSALMMAILKKLENENQLKFYVDSDLLKNRFSILTINGFMPIAELIPGEVNKSSVKLNGFKMNEDERFIGYIENDLLSHDSMILDRAGKTKMVDSFLELFSNVQKHARTEDPIFACGQFYTNRRLLSFTLVDLGVGYLPPIHQATNGVISNASEAISWALKGNTTKKDAPGGLGLSEILKFCQTNNATFDIITGDAYWRNTLTQPLVSKPFCGSMVNVIFDCNEKRNG